MWKLPIDSCLVQTVALTLTNTFGLLWNLTNITRILALVAELAQNLHSRNMISTNLFYQQLNWDDYLHDVTSIFIF